MARAAAVDQAREELTKSGEELSFIEFWKEQENIELLKPRGDAQPFVWHWNDIGPKVGLPTARSSRSPSFKRH